MPPRSAQCTEARQFIEEIRTVMDEIVALEAREPARTGSEGEPVRLTLRLLRERKDSLLQRYEAHLRSHECGAPTDGVPTAWAAPVQFRASD